MLFTRSSLLSRSLVRNNIDLHPYILSSFYCKQHHQSLSHLLIYSIVYYFYVNLDSFFFLLIGFAKQRYQVSFQMMADAIVCSYTAVLRRFFITLSMKIKFQIGFHFQMPDTVVTNQLPARTTTNHRWPRKSSTLGGRDLSSSTTIPTNDSDLIDNSSKTNGHHRHSTSLFRKSSTKSRTDDIENTPSLQKSRSLMNVIRSKLNSPSVFRRFRSKSRESTKQNVTEIIDQPPEEITRKKSLSLPKSSQSNDENNNETITTTRKSRKRDPSPMRRFANRIAQLTRN
jgi:hypothetical protein